MRTGLGVAVREELGQNIESTTFTVLHGAVVDALLSAAGIFHEREAFVFDDHSETLKKIESRLHFDGFEIQNMDITLSVRNPLPESMLRVFEEKIGKLLFLERDQLTVKQYVFDRFPYGLHVQAMVLIG